MSTPRMQVSALLALGLVATAALHAHGAPAVREVGGAQPLQLSAPEPAPGSAVRQGPSLEQQVKELRAQLDSLRRVLVVDANGNVTLRADHDLLLKAGNVLEGSSVNDAKLKSGKGLELEAAQDAKLRTGRNLRLDGSGDIDVRGTGINLRSSATLDARAALIKLN